MSGPLLDENFKPIKWPWTALFPAVLDVQTRIPWTDPSASHQEKRLVRHGSYSVTYTDAPSEIISSGNDPSDSDLFTMSVFRARELESLLEREGYTLNLERVEFDGGTSATLDTFFHGLGGSVNEPMDVLCTIDGLNGTYLASELWEIYWMEDLDRLVAWLDDRWLEASADRA